MRSKKIGIVHYRVGRTDGVSLEIEKRKSILKNLGYEVRLISGSVQKGADHIIDELEFDTPEISEIKENSFRFFGRNSLDERALMRRIEDVSIRIERAFLRIHQHEKFDALLVHNLFSHGRHIAAASAFTRIAEKLHIPILATHHDFYWERNEYQEPRGERIAHHLATYVPPKIGTVTHVCINSLARDALLERRGLQSLVFPDVFDFKQDPWMRDDYNDDFLQTIGVKADDLIVLQATRIVRRKGIEIAIDFVRQLTDRKAQLEGIELYNGKLFRGNSNIVLLLAGYAEQSDLDYLRQLEDRVAEAGIQVRFISSHIGAQRSIEGGKVYSLWDAYVFADLVTYPSLFEGWGNQFIEAVFARKVIALFEYSVFEADIRGEGYRYVSLGSDVCQEAMRGLVRIPDQKMREAVEHTLTVLISDRTKNMLERNFKIGERYHGYHVLEQFFRDHVLTR